MQSDMLELDFSIRHFFDHWPIERSSELLYWLVVVWGIHRCDSMKSPNWSGISIGQFSSWSSAFGLRPLKFYTKSNRNCIKSDSRIEKSVSFVCEESTWKPLSVAIRMGNTRAPNWVSSKFCHASSPTIRCRVYWTVASAEWTANRTNRYNVIWSVRWRCPRRGHTLWCACPWTFSGTNPKCFAIDRVSNTFPPTNTEWD